MDLKVNLDRFGLSLSKKKFGHTTSDTLNAILRAMGRLYKPNRHRLLALHACHLKFTFPMLHFTQLRPLDDRLRATARYLSRLQQFCDKASGTFMPL